MFGGTTGTWLSIDHARWFGLADAFPGVGFYGLGGGEFSWLAFRHVKYEYGGSATGVEGPLVLLPGWGAGNHGRARFFQRNE